MCVVVVVVVVVVDSFFLILKIGMKTYLPRYSFPFSLLVSSCL
jgi:hypothetical protein